MSVLESLKKAQLKTVKVSEFTIRELTFHQTQLMHQAITENKDMLAEYTIAFSLLESDGTPSHEASDVHALASAIAQMPNEKVNQLFIACDDLSLVTEKAVQKTKKNSKRALTNKS